MLKPPPKPAGEPIGAVVLVASAVLLFAGTAAAAPVPSAAPSEIPPPASSIDAVQKPASREGARELHLAVTINGQPTRFISQFREVGVGRLSSKRSELEELGVRVPGTGAADQVINLDELPALKYSYDEPKQTVDLTLGDENRLRKSYAFDDGREAIKPTPSNFGALLNYNLFGAAQQTTDNIWSRMPSFQGANASLEGRLLSPWGTLTQTGVMGTTLSHEDGFLRLQTTFSYDHYDTQMSYRVGDSVSGGLAWTRPIRFGGVQAQRSFGIRPDLVQMSIPGLTGSAAVPSTVDVYVNSVKTYSQQVSAGPFELNNVPMMTGAGTARIVVRDASGKETETSMPFYTAPRILKQGVYDFSVEAGAPRMDYGVLSNEYAETVVGSGSLRLGITDWLTAEAHAEGSDKLINGGLGVAARAGGFGIASAAVSGSHSETSDGSQAYVAADTQIGKVSLHAHTQRTFGGYDDLASVTGKLRSTLPVLAASTHFITGTIGNIKPPKVTDVASVTLPTLFDSTFLTLSYVHLTPQEGKSTQIATASYTRPLFGKSTMFATAFKDLDDARNVGVFVGVSVPLDHGVSASANAARTSTGTTVGASASKALGQQPGDYGWHVMDSEGEMTYRSASGAYRSSFARVEGSVRQDRSNVRTTAEVEGSVVAMGGQVFAANRIDDGFAVVDTGAPGVKVMRENNLVGETNASGKLLVPNLNSYQRNKLSIDPNGLPIDARIDQTSLLVAPMLRGGIDVRFDVKKELPSAIVVLRGADGKDIPSGSAGVVEGAKDTFVVGHDGRAYVSGLKSSNTVVVTIAGKECRATFAFTPKEGTQSVVGPVVCQ